MQSAQNPIMASPPRPLVHPSFRRAMRLRTYQRLAAPLFDRSRQRCIILRFAHESRLPKPKRNRLLSQLIYLRLLNLPPLRSKETDPGRLQSSFRARPISLRHHLYLYLVLTSFKKSSRTQPRKALEPASIPPIHKTHFHRHLPPKSVFQLDTSKSALCSVPNLFASPRLLPESHSMTISIAEMRERNERLPCRRWCQRGVALVVGQCAYCWRPTLHHWRIQSCCRSFARSSGNGSGRTAADQSLHVLRQPQR